MSDVPGVAFMNGRAAPLNEARVLDFARFRETVLQCVEAGSRVSALFGCPRPDGGLRLYAVIACPGQGDIGIAATDVAESFRSLTPDCPEVHWFEREIAEQWAVRPEGHPWLKPIRFHASYRPGRDAWDRRPEQIEPAVTDYFRVEGEEVHEVAVGPVHAGIIEPGHFRFQCHGENVYHLEISLGYQHRGIERALVGLPRRSGAETGGPDKRTIHFMETAAGDTTIGHATAYCRTVEGLAGCAVPARAQTLRGIALELERVANHVGDLGALAGDVGFLPTMSFCGRLRGDVLNMTAVLSGNRFGRGLVRPGGVAFDVDGRIVEDLLRRLDAVSKDTRSAVELLWNTPSVTARFEGTGALSAEEAQSAGLVGPAARACGLERDVRKDNPFGIFRVAHIPVTTWDTGDVFGRAWVRYIEVQRSLAFVREQLAALPAGPVRAEVGRPAPESMVVSLVEGWRGEICHVAITDGAGRLGGYKIVDPSFHNWFGLALAMRGEAISDFPLCNKSFNLSYCGHDL